MKKNIVGDNIRKLRLQLGFTQEDLALKCGLSQGYINQLESGKRRFTQKSLESIANVLSIPIVDLFRGEETQQPVVAVKVKEFKERRPNKREFLKLLNELPDHIIRHYFALLKLEIELLRKEKGAR